MAVARNEKSHDRSGLRQANAMTALAREVLRNVSINRMLSGPFPC